MFLLKLSLRPWRLSPFSQIFSCFSLGLLLFLLGLLYCLESGLKPVLYRLRTEQVVTAYLNSTENPENIIDSIRLAVGAQSIKLIKQEEFLDEIKVNYPELGKELDQLGGEKSKIIPRYISVEGKLPKDAVEKIQAISGVESAETSLPRSRSIVGAFSALRKTAKIFMGVIFLVLLMGLIHLSRMNAFSQQETLALLKLWGAGFFQLRLTGILTGIWIGLGSGVVAFFTWTYCASGIFEKIKSFSPQLEEIESIDFRVGVTLFVMSLGLGLLTGVFSRVLSSVKGS